MKTINLSLDPNELRQAANELREYAREFELKVKAFIEACADHGIMIATMNEGDFAGYIVYSKKFEEKDGDYTVYIAASDTPILRSWYTSATGGKMKEAYISPLLMAEFGSGWNASTDIPPDLEGIAGHGTLNTYGHANQPSGWSWWTSDASDQTDAQFLKSEGGRYLFTTRGIKPTRPLHNAVQSLISDVEGIAVGIFH